MGAGLLGGVVVKSTSIFFSFFSCFFLLLSMPPFALSSNSTRPLSSKTQREALSKRYLVSGRGCFGKVRGTELSGCGALTEERKKKRGLRRALYFCFCHERFISRAEH
jgi:hypothetical protein